MPDSNLDKQLKQLEQEHRDLDEILNSNSRKTNC